WRARRGTIVLVTSRSLGRGLLNLTDELIWREAAPTTSVGAWKRPRVPQIARQSGLTNRDKPQMLAQTLSTAKKFGLSGCGSQRPDIRSSVVVPGLWFR